MMISVNDAGIEIPVDTDADTYRDTDSLTRRDDVHLCKPLEI